MEKIRIRCEDIKFDYPLQTLQDEMENSSNVFMKG